MRQETSYATLTVDAVRSMALNVMIECEACGHFARMSASRLERLCRDRRPMLSEVAGMSRCKGCGAKGRASIQPLLPPDFSKDFRIA